MQTDGIQGGGELLGLADHRTRRLAEATRRLTRGRAALASGDGRRAPEPDTADRTISRYLQQLSRAWRAARNDDQPTQPALACARAGEKEKRACP